MAADRTDAIKTGPPADTNGADTQTRPDLLWDQEAPACVCASTEAGRNHFSSFIAATTLLTIGKTPRWRSRLPVRASRE
jgi:hypothetical protein